LEGALDRLARALARGRLGAGLAAGLRGHIETLPARLEGLGPPDRLVHGDLGGRNLMVSENGASSHRIAGLIDWEHAAAGWPLSDVGSLFRYSTRFPPRFRDRFHQGYEEAGGSLPEDWWRTVRLLDSTRLVGILAGDRDLPGIFQECHGLLERLVDDLSPGAPPG
jgi:Ser/Thr protein kinase RdoA (MazF antagonist)